MFQKFMQERYYCGLDVGSQTVKAALIEIQGQDPAPKLLGAFEVPAAGFQDGSISDLAELSESIHEAVNGISKKAGVNLQEVQMGLSAGVIEARLSPAVIPLMDRGSKIITERDIHRIQAQARALGLNVEETLIHDFVQYYKVDDVNTALNPLGLYGRKLEVQSLLIVVNNTFLKNLAKAVNQAGYDLGKIFFTSYASSYAILNDQDRKEGSIFLDIGSSASDMLIFKDNRLKCEVKLPRGGSDITKNIAAKLDIGLDLAEDIKTSYASALESDNVSDEEILIKRDEGYFPVKKHLIAAAVEPVVSEIVGALADEVKKTGYYHQVRNGMVMAGGGALLAGLPERFEKDTNLHVKLGQVRLAQRRLSSASKFAGAVGLAQLGWRESSRKKRASTVENLPQYIAGKVKELYNEYF